MLTLFPKKVKFFVVEKVGWWYTVQKLSNPKRGMAIRMQQVTIYREPGRYAGWPANYGIWAYGNEIVVGFTVGYHKSDAGFHRRDRDKPFIGMQARSLDGGETWRIAETPCRLPARGTLSADEHVEERHRLEAEASFQIPHRVNFTHPDFAMMCSRSGLRAGAYSWFYTSTDRCQSWNGPFKLPMFGYTGIAARTDYLVSSADECLLFLTASKADGQEGLIFCANTTDGGESFSLLSQIGPEPEGFAIMPASVRLSDSRILVAVRCRGRGNDSGSDWEERLNWIDLYRSEDNGQTWDYMNRPVENTGRGGNPPTLTLLHDGRLCLIFGYRDAPHRICAKLSSDAGETWSEEIVLRDNGGDPDIGYPRTIQRPDGTVVTAYYFDEEPDGERFIEATLWKP